MESPTSWELLWKRLSKDNQIFWQILVSLGFSTIIFITFLFVRRFCGWEDEPDENEVEMQKLAESFVQELEATKELLDELKRIYCSEFQNEMEDELSQPQTTISCAGDGNLRD
jgi:5-bromo-4-chloroindolyl phosphate hydrolysis protein